MELPFGGTFAKDTETGPGRRLRRDDLDRRLRRPVARRPARDSIWHAKAEGNAVADYGFHMIMSDVNDDTLAEMDGLVAEGVPDFKLFTAYRASSTATTGRSSGRCSRPRRTAG